MAKDFVNFNGESIENDLNVDTSTPGLMSNQDKTKLDGIADGANKTVVDSALNSTSTNSVQNKVINSALAGKASTAVATQTTSGLSSAADKTKLDGIATNANNYVHPTTHPATMIVEDTGHRFITDAERTAWNAKAPTTLASTTINGLMSAAMVTKLNGIAAGANNYVHPADANTRHVTDAQITAWNGKASTAVATTTANGLMSAADKVKLNGAASYTYGVSGTSHYKKHADGTLEMWGRFPLSYTNQLWSSTLATSGFSYSVPFTITFPVTTVGDVVCNINIESSNVSWASIQSYTTTALRYILVCPSPDKSYSAYIHWSVLGKWK